MINPGGCLGKDLSRNGFSWKGKRVIQMVEVGCVLGMAFGCWKQCVVPGCVVGNEEHLQCGFVTNVCGAIMDD